MQQIFRGVVMALFLGQAGFGMADEASVTAELYAAASSQQKKPELVMVGTIDEQGFPQTRVMSNLRNAAQTASKLFGENIFNTFAVTRADTEKLQHLAKNPHMSMYYQDGGQGLLLMGKGEIVTDPATRHAVWDDAFKRMNYSGPDDPMLVVLRFTPTHGKFYYQRKQNHLTFTKDDDTNTNDRAAIEKTIAVYIDGHRQGKSDAMRPAFHPGATIFLGSKSDPVQLLYDMTDQRPAAAEIKYEIGSIEISDTIANARVELFNCYGHRFSDMFTLVKTDDGWKITCKVSRMHQ